MQYQSYRCACVCCQDADQLPQRSGSLQLPSTGDQLHLASMLNAKSDEDDSDSSMKKTSKRLSVGTERRVHVSEQLRQMFHALPGLMGEDTSQVLSVSAD